MTWAMSRSECVASSCEASTVRSSFFMPSSAQASWTSLVGRTARRSRSSSLRRGHAGAVIRGGEDASAAVVAPRGPGEEDGLEGRRPTVRRCAMLVRMHPSASPGNHHGIGRAVRPRRPWTDHIGDQLCSRCIVRRSPSRRTVELLRVPSSDTAIVASIRCRFDRGQVVHREGRRGREGQQDLCQPFTNGESVSLHNTLIHLRPPRPPRFIRRHRHRSGDK